MILRTGLLLVSLLTPVMAFASVKGVGEYHYGPDTAQNLACFFAEERAKENAIQNFSGSIIESTVSELCLTNECIFHRETNNNTTGVVRGIKSKMTDIRTEEGQRVCTVEIDAVVERLQKNIVFSLDHFSPVFSDNQIVQFSIIVNRPGKLVLFNYFDGNYHKIYESQNNVVNESFVVPAKDRMIAKVPEGLMTSKEKLVFVYTDVDISVNKLYNDFEMRTFLQSIPVQKRFVTHRFIQIVR
jgi:hypothetical protein